MIIILRFDHIVSASSIVNVKTLLPEIRQALVQKNILDTEICQTSKIMISGVLYESGMYVVTDCVELEVLELSKILGIYLQRKHLNSVGVNAENVILVTEIQKSRYDCHLGAFEMLNMNKINVCNLSELVDYYPLDEYIVTGIKYACLKHLVTKV
ncbi:hypothetical protein SNE40_009829 [Patella caerulea]|uniref:Uncharacterized protein n=1 Tax=Patella caerulea TaxID=87958 RepID=A0AAN8JTA7_PATCE